MTYDLKNIYIYWMESDSQVWKGALWVEVQSVDCDVLTAGEILLRRLLHAQVVFRSAVPINLYVFKCHIYSLTS